MPFYFLDRAPSHPHIVLSLLLGLGPERQIWNLKSESKEINTSQSTRISNQIQIKETRTQISDAALCSRMETVIEKTYGRPRSLPNSIDWIKWQAIEKKKKTTYVEISNSINIIFRMCQAETDRARPLSWVISCVSVSLPRSTSLAHLPNKNEVELRFYGAQIL